MSEQFANPEYFDEPSGAELAQILSMLGEDFGFDDETCGEVASMSFDDAFEAAYGYLTQAGLDPDEMLTGFFD
jgi:hypothetical protein